MADDEQGPEYEYGEREVPAMEHKFFAPGQGRISGYLSVTLGVMSLLGVLCFKFPELLTTGELREVYDVELLRTILMVCMWTAVALGAWTFIRGKRRNLGGIGILLTIVGFALGGYTIPGRDVDPQVVSLGVDWMLLDLLGSSIIFIFIEKLAPRYPDQAILRPEWQLDLLYFCINHLAVGILLLVGNRFAPAAFGWAVHEGAQSWISGAPMLLQFALLVLAADFVQYWVHRTFHERKRLWRVHAVHHSAEHMDWIAGSRNHLAQIVVDRSLVMVPLYLLGTTQGALDAYVVFAGFQAVFVHANVRWKFGLLKWIFVTPQFHHWHHSSDEPAIDSNYGVHVVLYDKLFGTFHMPDEHWPREYGTTKRLPRTFWGQLKYPFGS